MSLCLCKSSLEEGQGGEGFSFHPLYFFLSCPIHPTSDERLQQSDFQGRGFEPPAIRFWSLGDYFNDAVDDIHHSQSEPSFVKEAGSGTERSGSQSKTPTSFSPGLPHAGGIHVDIDFSNDRENDGSETDLGHRTLHQYDVGSWLPGNASQRQITPGHDDWERYKNVIEELYMRQNLSLEQVRNAMESKYGIRATTKMYKYRFQKWKWAKYSPRGHTAAKEPGQVVLQRAGRSRTKPSELETFRLRAVRELRRVRRQEYFFVHPLLHQNDHARDLNTILTLTQHFIVGETEKSLHRSSHPTFESTRRFSSGSDTDMYQTFVSALAAFSLNDFVLGGRLLRRAFRALEKEINHLGFIRSVEYCFSVPCLFITYGRNDLATLLLKYMAPRLQMIPKRHPLAIICGPLLSVVQDPGRTSRDSLGRVLQLGADAFAKAHAGDFRAVLYFRARFCTLDTEAAENMFFCYQGLAVECSARLGDMHHTTLSTEREMLDLAARYRLKPAVAKDLCELVIAKIEGYYEERSTPTQRWSHSHQKLWMDLRCLLVEIVASGGDVQQAIKGSRETYEFVANTDGCLPSTRWYAINSFQIWLETMVYSLGQMDVGDEFRRSRLSSEQYLVLDKESVDEEEDFLNSHN